MTLSEEDHQEVLRRRFCHRVKLPQTHPVTQAAMRAARHWRTVITAFLVCDSLQPCSASFLQAARACMLQSQAKQTELCDQCVTRPLWRLALRAHLATISVLSVASFVFPLSRGPDYLSMSCTQLLALMCPSSDLSHSNTQGTSTFSLCKNILSSTFIMACLIQRRKWQHSSVVEVSSAFQFCLLTWCCVKVLHFPKYVLNQKHDKIVI